MRLKSPAGHLDLVHENRLDTLRIEPENEVGRARPAIDTRAGLSGSAELLNVMWQPGGKGILFSQAEKMDYWHSPVAIDLWHLEFSDDKGIGAPTKLLGQEDLDRPGGFGVYPMRPGVGFAVGAEPAASDILFVSLHTGASTYPDGTRTWALYLAGSDAPRAVDLGTTIGNRRYRSWAPDGSALAYTAGGTRFAMYNKWLNIYDVASGSVTTVVTGSQQVPGIVAWSPVGDLIAYAAVPAAETSWDLATTNRYGFDNPAVLGRRIYLLDVATGTRARLNADEVFQDSPVWSDDGRTLCYVARRGSRLQLIRVEGETREEQPAKGASMALPERLGYYGQSDFDDLVAQCVARDT